MKRHAITSPSCAPVAVVPPAGKVAMTARDEEGKEFFVTDGDTGHILKFGVTGAHDGAALVHFDRRKQNLWLPVGNLELLHTTPTHQHD